MNEPLFTTSTKAGTAGGFLTVLLGNIISPQDVLKTVIMAVIGASVSVGVSLFWRWVGRRR